MTATESNAFPRYETAQKLGPEFDLSVIDELAVDQIAPGVDPVHMSDSTSSADQSIEGNKVDNDRAPFKIEVMKLDNDPVVLQMKVY